MKGEKEFFRKRFFGGFNRDDVMKYIARIAEERNEAVSAKEKAERGIRAITEELNRANSTREDAERDVRSLAEERNQAIDAKEKAEKDARTFAEELRRLREETSSPVAEVVDNAADEVVIRQFLRAGTAESPVAREMACPAARNKREFEFVIIARKIEVAVRDDRVVLRIDFYKRAAR